jgi:hypothetical protein
MGNGGVDLDTRIYDGPGRVRSGRDRVHQRLGKALQPMILTIARSVELMTVDIPAPRVEATTVRRTARARQRASRATSAMGSFPPKVHRRAEEPANGRAGALARGAAYYSF